MPTLKSPTEPILLSDKSFQWLEGKLSQNEKRKKMTKLEKEYYEGAVCFDEELKSMI